MDNKHFREKVKEKRKELDLSSDNLATLSHITEGYLKKNISINSKGKKIIIYMLVSYITMQNIE